MDIEKLRAPAGLCGYHRSTWKMLTVRCRPRLAAFAEKMCRGGNSRFCTWEWESTK